MDNTLFIADPLSEVITVQTGVEPTVLEVHQSVMKQVGGK